MGKKSNIKYGHHFEDEIEESEEVFENNYEQTDEEKENYEEYKKSIEDEEYEKLYQEYTMLEEEESFDSFICKKIELAKLQGNTELEQRLNKLYEDYIIDDYDVSNWYRDYYSDFLESDFDTYSDYLWDLYMESNDRRYIDAYRYAKEVEEKEEAKQNNDSANDIESLKEMKLKLEKELEDLNEKTLSAEKLLSECEKLLGEAERHDENTH